ncbi:glycosyltransferase family 39 protein [filamentous cyanobacterium LEGE 11480]|uniref:Glycosyltransferase family 39 protein n=1 Tax=Romeriopsis navalis LEGE 11480 TaxID=2777977 RepID=A0A928Z3Z1_9CYAN|nr:glycosyltransferase family 39 protein [Romeriopsis navalis]MBE9031189.1 glycosyltransferase family 39 protein [Romeriopsis navalis LEGE 11480]
MVWLIGLGLDRLWLRLDYGVPNAVQSQQLNLLLDMSQLGVLKGVSNPLMYRIGGWVQAAVGSRLDQLLWSQAIFSGLLLIAVYGLGARLFSRQVGLWAAGFSVLLPALLALRLQFSLDLPLVALVLLGLWRLVVWRQAGKSPWPRRPKPLTNAAAFGLESEALPWERELQLLRQTIASRTVAGVSGRSVKLSRGWQLRHYKLPQLPAAWRSWWDAIVLGIVLGLAWLTHPLAVIYLVVPFVWAGLVQLLGRHWWRSCQWVLAGLISWTIAWPWYRRNLPDLMLSALRSPTVGSAELWQGNWPWLIGSLGQLATQAFYPLLLVGVLGLLLYRQRVAMVVAGGRNSGMSSSVRLWRRQVNRLWTRSVTWLLSCILLPLVIGVGCLPLAPNALLPVLPLLIILLTQGLLLFPRSFFQIRWFLLLLMIVWSVSNLFPIVPLRTPHQLAQPAQDWHQAALLKTVAQESPGVQQTIGVLPQTDQVNADYLTYLARSFKLPVRATTVGLDAKQIWQDRRSLPWYVLATGKSAAKSPSQVQFAQAIRNDRALQLTQTWNLPNGDDLQLFQRRQAVVQVTPIVGAQWSEDLPIHLEKVIVPPQAQSGKPIPVAYTWAGQPQELQAGLVELTWRRVNDGQQPQAVKQWWHDHAIGLGKVQPLASQAELMQVTERLAMIAPAGTAGRYQLEAQYLDPLKNARYPLKMPDASIEIVRQVKSVKSALVPELDLITQMRSLSRLLVQSSNFARWQQQIGRLDRYDPTHTSLVQWQLLTRDRLDQQPDNPGLYYDLALAQFLDGNMRGAIEALERGVKMTPKNFQPQLYLAIAHAGSGDARSAKLALQQAQQLRPDFVVPSLLKTLLAALQGNPIAQWRLYRLRLDLMSPSPLRMN